MEFMSSKISDESMAAFLNLFFGAIPRLIRSEVPRFVMPGPLDGVVEKNISSAKEFCDKLAGATRNSIETVESSVKAATSTAANLHLKYVQAAHANSDAGLEFAHKLLGVKSATDFTELSTSHARKQLELWVDQVKELVTLSQRFTSETVEPIANGLAKVLKAAA